MFSQHSDSGESSLDDSGDETRVHGLVQGGKGNRNLKRGLGHKRSYRPMGRRMAKKLRFVLDKIPFKNHNQYSSTEYHYRLSVKLNKKIVPLMYALESGFLDALRKVLNELKEKHDDVAFIMSLVHDGLDAPIRGKLTNFNQSFEPLIEHFKHELEKVMTSKRSLKADKSLGNYHKLLLFNHFGQ